MSADTKNLLDIVMSKVDDDPRGHLKFTVLDISGGTATIMFTIGSEVEDYYSVGTVLVRKRDVVHLMGVGRAFEISLDTV